MKVGGAGLAKGEGNASKAATIWMSWGYNRLYPATRFLTPTWLGFRLTGENTMFVIILNAYV